MSEIVIKVEGLGKKYIIGHKGTKGYKTFREEILHHFHNFYSRTKKLVSGQEVLEGDEIEVFWALKELSFEIKQGDRVGIIGKNGAGKSTLLKILSRITEPTTGKISINGRIASLLEVGTGFHQELTGRENIFLNGAILGMSRAEIKRKFDEIVDFSGVEKFLDTPVKRYSSGMYVRLAFSVAAHLEPEILIVDEVLAVGDADFQKKCLGKMNDISNKDGRTILFVSHSMPTIQKLCNKGMFLQNGSMLINSSIKQAVDAYIDQRNIATYESKFEVDPSKDASVKQIEIVDNGGNPLGEIPIGRKWTIKIIFQINQPVSDFITAIGIVNSMDIPIHTSWQTPSSFKPGLYCAEFSANDTVYAAGNYRINVGLSKGLSTIQYMENVINLNIVSIIDDVDEKVLVYENASGIVLNPLNMKTYELSA